jgi:hypothetical protein
MHLHTKNSQTFEERGFVMLACLEAAREAAFKRVADKARALRSSYFEEMNKIVAMSRQQDDELLAESNDA